MLLANDNFLAIRDTDPDMADLGDGRTDGTTYELVAELTHRGYTIFTNEDFDAFLLRCECIAQALRIKSSAEALVACKGFFEEITGFLIP